MNNTLHTLNRSFKLYFSFQRLAQTIVVEVIQSLVLLINNMKTIWLHLRDTVVNSEECVSSSSGGNLFDSSKIRDILCREVTENIGRISTTNYRKKSECQVVYFLCPTKKCPIQWRVTVSPHVNEKKERCNAMKHICIERSEGTHNHDELNCFSSLPRSAGSFINENNNFPVMILFNEIKKRKLCENMNPIELKKKISHSKWYSRRKEKRNKQQGNGGSLQALKIYLESRTVKLGDVNMTSLKGELMFSEINLGENCDN